ncbi:hypothetical protein LOY97_002312 [Ophidiomyces ophidiicola]|nr:hypothetical protein LOZ49_003497 [Ophidiomyces ophidiicola]KAI2018098.1 hypothetical protein LOZ46_004128 [Ophidiomyces ophidiicola]KAI2134316.1 hypothetical protein LOZ28_005020 [Ophidiomyces ophidiicola]KAI2136718.1 hypothetical protein LOZ29_003420 [Ophidiomyces ophidiicola]KAI2218835.1 hypothetical protein LOZ15_002970 [Ophidiomyces ophidiicola]
MKSLVPQLRPPSGREPQILQEWAARIRHECQLSNKSKSQHSHILGLPLELILIIVEYLSPAGARIFSYSCRRFFYQSDSWANRAILFPEDVFEYICLLEKCDFTSKLVCRGCSRFHDHDKFSPSELEKDPTVRFCCYTKPVLYVCVHHTLSFKDVETWNIFLRNQGRYHVRGWDVGRPYCQTSNPNSGTLSEPCFVVSTERPGISMLTNIFVQRIWEPNLPNKQQIQKRMATDDTPVCPHMRLDDPRFVESYDPDTLVARFNATTVENQLFEPSIEDELVQCGHQHCDTVAHWSYRRNANEQGNGNLQILTLRRLGTLPNPHDPIWLAQTTPV